MTGTAYRWEFPVARGIFSLWECDGAVAGSALPGSGVRFPGILYRTKLLAEAEKQLTEYFSGIRRRFELPLAPQGSCFQLAVWHAMAQIPYGECRTYGALARAAGCPQGARAVGQACHRNPLPVLLPCHRVVGSRGKLTGFAGGIEWKKYLLELEHGENHFCS